MKKFLDLGLQPLANSYLDKRDLNKKKKNLIYKSHLILKIILFLF